MKPMPILTEKSLQDAKGGFYSFWVSRLLTKSQIKASVGEIYKVHIKEVRTINYKGGVKKNYRGRKVAIKAQKKAIVKLAKGEKIELFETKK